MTTGDNRRVFALVLAAGAARRFGATKQLAQIDGVAMARRALDAATACCGNQTVLVLGHDAAAVAAACRPAPGFVVINDDYEQGLGTSLACGVKAIRHAASAVIVTLADQALVPAPHLVALRDRWSGADNEIVATDSGTVTGPPVLFSRACFEDLLGLSGDNGGRKLLDDSRFSVARIRCDAAAVDVDTAADLEEIASLRSQ